MNKAHTIARPLEPARLQPSSTEGDGRLVLNVVFTSLEGTAAALKSARSMAHDLRGVIRLEVPIVVPWQLPLDRPPVSVRFTEELLTRMVDRLDLQAFEPNIHLYLCRDRLDALTQILRPDSVVVIGARRHWWPTEESRLAKTLLAWGNRVVFVKLGGGMIWDWR